MKKAYVKKLLVLFGLFSLLLSGCRKQDTQSFPAQDAYNTSTNRFDSYVAQSWYALMLRLIAETPGHTPPIAARSFGYAGVALYEAVLGATPQHHSLAGQLNGLTSLPIKAYGAVYIAPLTANAALARLVKKLFQNAKVTNLQSIDTLEADNEKMYAPGNREEIITRAKDYGYSLADDVYNWSLSDGGHEAYLRNFPQDYIRPEGEEKWTPTPPLFQSAMLPYWGQNRTMLAANTSDLVNPVAPPLFSTAQHSDFYNAALEVYETGKHLTPEQKTIGLYWNDGTGSVTPPGHNIAIALQLIRNLHLNLSQAVIVLAKIGIALNDVAIVCWRAKFQHNLLRPISYINRYMDALWTPLITTPPFPSYTSGHSSFSAATVLSTNLGTSVAFTDSTKLKEGFSSRFFSSFKAYAQEAAESRLYGGIHYRFDNDAGFRCGESVAANIEKLLW